jgi:hypothetical protein
VRHRLALPALELDPSKDVVRYPEPEGAHLELGAAAQTVNSVLIAAVKEFRKLQKFRHRLERARQRKENRPTFHATERELDRLDARWNALFDFIYRTPAAGLTGAAAKLRMLSISAYPRIATPLGFQVCTAVTSSIWICVGGRSDSLCILSELLG